MITYKISSFRDHPLDGINFPTLDSERKKTDILCTIIGGLFALTLFVLAFVFLNTGNPYPMKIIIGKAISLLTLIMYLAPMV